MIFYVTEQFDSLEGEGIRTGQTASFVRLAGCNLRCTYCDTPQAWQGGTPMGLEDILAQVNPAFSRVTLTGGEPLYAEHGQHAAALVAALQQRGYEVNIETNGSIDIAAFRARVQEAGAVEPGLFFTIDYKLPHSGVCEAMHMANYFTLRPQDVVKFVVGGPQDIPALRHMVWQMLNTYTAWGTALPGTSIPHIFVGAVHGAMPLPELAALLVNDPVLVRAHARLQLQLHKVVWGAHAQGV